MKRLDQMTMREYIDIRCGEYQEGITDKDAVRIIYEYQNISDPASMKSYLHKASNEIKDGMRLRILNIIKVLIKMGYPDEARSVYEDYSNAKFIGAADQLEVVVNRKVMQLEFSIKRAADIEKQNNQQQSFPPDVIRRKYDEEVASLMAYHKMPISIDTITAGVYAHLVRNTYREIKSRFAQFNKKN